MNTSKLFIGQRVNVENIITESWQSEKKLFNGVVKGIDGNCIWVSADEKTTTNGAFDFMGGHYYLSAYLITPIENEDLFQVLGEIFKPEQPIKRYMVKTESKGVLFFDELPKGTYFQEGSRNIEEKGTAMYYTFDTCGTCLIPIIDTTTMQQVKDLNRAGQSLS